MHYTLTRGRNSQNLYVGSCSDSQAGIEARFRIGSISKDFNGPFELFKDIMIGTIKSSKVVEEEYLGFFPEFQEALKTAYFSAREHVKKILAASRELGQEASFSDQTGLTDLAEQVIINGDLIHPDTIEF